MATGVSDLSVELNRAIQDFLWGKPSDWKRKMRTVLRQLPPHGFYSLKDVVSYRSYSNVIESEDCFYCGKCGEKVLCFALSFYKNTCEVCI
jgi:hypothetical protein